MNAQDHDEATAQRLAALGRKLPGWTFWAGESTHHVWACPPADSGLRLMGAEDVDRLEPRVSEAVSWLNSRRPPRRR